MELVVIGVNHRRAPLALREKLAFSDAELTGALQALRETAKSSEEVILSTCNRVEIYLTRDDPFDSAQGGSTDPALQAVAGFLASRRGVPAADVAAVLYAHAGPDAVRHLFRVASSLDSMVLGESQILAQVKGAYEAARQAGHTARVFNQLFQRALFAAKRVRAETSIGEKNASVPSAAAALARKVFQDLSTKRAMVIGAGETATLTLQAFKERGIGGAIVVNRTLDHARELAERLGAESHALDRLDELLPRADVIIACLSTPEFVLTPARISAALQARRGGPMFIIDLAVPRSVNPEVNALDNVYLFNVDDLEGIVNRNLVEREREVALASPIVEAEAAAALKDIELLDVEKVLSRLRQSYHDVGDEEMKKSLDRLHLTAEQREEVGQVVHRILNKVLHAPTTGLKEEAHDGRGAGLIELALKLFGLKK